MNGSEITIGDTIIIPMAVRMLVMTRSITMNGRYSSTPISNARVSSAVTKDGARMKMSFSVGFIAVPACISCAACRKKARSPGVVKRRRNARTGASPCSIKPGHWPGWVSDSMPPAWFTAAKDCAITGDMT